MKTLPISIIISAAISAFAGVPISRTVDVSATIKPIALETYAGETLDLSVQLASGGAPLSTPSASATIYWQTNGMANAWWQTNMSCSASGLVTGSWSPGLPSGRVWFFVGVESSGLNYRVSGQCSILPSPSGAPSTAVLPPPGGTLNLGDYTVIGAPWITSSDSASAIASATDPLASEISELSERAASDATAARNYTDSVAAPLIAATNSITARLDSIVIPDVSGFASKTSLQAASNSLADAVQQLSSDLISSTNELHTSLSPTISAASTALQPSATNSLLTSLAPTVQLAATALQPSASNALSQAISALSQTVTYNAQQSGYDLAATSNALSQAIAALSQTVTYNAQQSGYDLAAASNALSQAIAALSQTVTYNAQQSGYDLSAASNALAQATAALAQTVAYNLQQSGYDLAATSNALAQSTADLSAEMAGLRSATDTQITSATNALNQSLAPTISSTSNALAQTTSDLAQKVDGLALVTATSNTAFRLMSLDGQIYQDATGTVWHTATAIGTSEWHAVSIQYTNGTTVATNEIPGIPSWSIDGSWQESEGVEYWIWTLRVPAGGNEYAAYGGIAKETSPADMSLQFSLGTGEISHLNFARTNTVSHYWAPVDHVLYSSSGGGGGGITTNDVCNIVTNVVTTDEWIYTGLPDGAIIHYPPEYIGDEWWTCVMSYNGENYDGSWDGPEDSTFMTFRFVNVTTPDDEDYIVSAEHRFTVRNALGLARLVDLPPLTNGLATAASLASLSSQLSQASQDATDYTDSATNSLLTSLAPTIQLASTALQPSAINNLLPKTGGTIYDITTDGGQLDVGSSNGYFGRVNINGALAELNVLGSNSALGGAYVNVGSTGVVSVLNVGGTNVMDRINTVNQSIAPTVSAAIAATDTSYQRIAGVTNINQTVQYVSIDSAVPTNLVIQLPTNGDTKDWIVYVTAHTNVTINLPAATWWLADASVTNDIAPQTPTALYFSQAAETIYTMGRQEFTEVQLP